MAAFVGRWKPLRELAELNGRDTFQQWDKRRWELRETAARLWSRPQVASATLSASGVLLGELQFPFAFADMEGEALQAPTARVHRRLFASYARKDLEVVESIDSVLRALDAGELRWDLKVLTSGVDWRAAVLKEIETADIFQLFWSKHAKASENVRQEWLYAIGLARPSFVRPVYWRDPLVSPPEELAHLHFARIELPAVRRFPRLVD
jgi:hypothetical protein